MSTRYKFIAKQLTNMKRTTTLIKLVILTTLINCISSSEAQVSKQQFKLLNYGMPNFEKQHAENVVAHKWGIEFYSVGGCQVTQELADSAEKENSIVEALIVKKYGKDWQEKFYKEVDCEFETEKKVTALIDQLDYIKKRQAEMQKVGNSLDYIMIPVANSTKYNVWVQGWGKWKGTNEWLNYYKLVVDHKTKSIKLLSNKIVKQSILQLPI